jgi:GT2 family glycosyltransferase
MRASEIIRLWRGESVLAALRIIRWLSGPSGLRRLYHGLVIHLVRSTGLFDRAYYLYQNGDVALDGMRPLRHYVAYGDREGRLPMPFFDPAYYRAHAPSRSAQVNALLHYAYIGRFRRTATSPWFSVEYYLANNKDVARSGVDPLLHYVQYGGLEGRSPCPQFDGVYYLHTNPEVLDQRINPLLHYLLYGIREGRRTLPDQHEAEQSDGSAGDAPRPSIPGDDQWRAIKAEWEDGRSEVTVVVPVYQGRSETLRCLYSVLSTAGETPFDLVVVNDASPDADLREDLQRLEGQGLLTLLSHDQNRGFVHSVNQGMALHRDRDVVLLNSDTEVYNGWLDRLRAAAHRQASTGTVTPLSNNATICSYPRFLHDNPFPLELGYADLDAMAAEVNAGVAVDAPTGVGFCMYIKRTCLDAVGPFDEQAFGRGYGEENDFCQRATRKGWRHILAADVFVRHWGAASFRGEKAKRVHAALKKMDQLHPAYRGDVDAFIKLDPLAEARRRLDWGRMKRMRRKTNVLIVSHNRGGGTERHIGEDIQRLTRAGSGVFLLRPSAGRPSHAVLGHPALKSLPNLPAFAMADVAAMRDAMVELGITEIHTHSLVDFAPESPDHLVELVRSLGARFEVNLHDYKVACPRVNLADEHGRYCGEPGEQECDQCLSTRGSDFGVQDIRAWREMHRRALLSADAVLVPDQDGADRLARYFPGVRLDVSPHEEIDRAAPSLRMSELLPDEKLRVVVIGAIGKLKGFDVVLTCAEHARRNGMPLEFVLMGYSMNDRVLGEAGVRVTGKYHEHEALSSLLMLQPHIVWLPSLWPETYSYTLSHALQAGLPVAAFDLGAIARRLRALGRDEGLMPLSLADRPGEVNALFLTLAGTLLKKTACCNVQ